MRIRVLWGDWEVPYLVGEVHGRAGGAISPLFFPRGWGGKGQTSADFVGFEVVREAPTPSAGGMDIGVMDREEGIDLVVDLELCGALLGQGIAETGTQFEGLLLIEARLGHDLGDIIRRERVVVLIGHGNDAVFVIRAAGQAHGEEEQDASQESSSAEGVFQRC